MAKKPVNKGGRPRKEIPREEAEKLCKIGCTQEEVADWFGVSIDTVSARCKEWGFEGFPEFYKRHFAKGKASLRREQFKLALKGNCTMLIWLGKQYLDQSDKIEQDNSGDFAFTLNYLPRSKRDGSGSDSE